MAITRIAEGDFTRAAGFIVLAGMFDVLDGMVARLTKSTSELGGQLDSLCDAISFGVAPAFLLYKVYFYAQGEFGVVLAALPAMAGVLRLARFNIQSAGSTDKLYFRGMPIPAGALTLLSYTLFYHTDAFQRGYGEIIPNDWKPLCITLVTLAVAGIMVSTMKYDAVPTPSAKAFRERPFVMAYFFAGFLLAVFSKGAWLFPFMLSYILIGVLRSSYNLIQSRFEPEDDDEDIEELE